MFIMFLTARAKLQLKFYSFMDSSGKNLPVVWQSESQKVYALWQNRLNSSNKTTFIKVFG